MKEMKCVAAILAGGRGIRLRPITDYIPKPMLPFGDDEKPVLEHIIEWIKSFGIRDFVLLVGYKYKQIVNYFRDGDRWDVNIRYSVDDDKHKGTGGALLKAHKNRLFDEFEHVLVWYGDIIAKVNVKDLMNKHEKEKCDVTIVATKKYRLPVGLLKVSDSIVTQVLEKPVLNEFVGIGIFVFNRSILNYLENVRVRKTSCDIAVDFLPLLLEKNMVIKVYQCDEWLDVGHK